MTTLEIILAFSAGAWFSTILWIIALRAHLVGKPANEPLRGAESERKAVPPQGGSGGKPPSHNRFAPCDRCGESWVPSYFEKPSFCAKCKDAAVKEFAERAGARPETIKAPITDPLRASAVAQQGRYPYHVPMSALYPEKYL